MKYQKIRKICTRCDDKFVPTSKVEKLCEKCWQESKSKRRYYPDEDDYICEHQDEKTKYKTVYKKGRGIKCHSPKQN